MTNYGDFDPTSSISIEGTQQSSFHQQHQQNLNQQQKRQQQQQHQNWILLNKHESLRDQSDSRRIIYHKPLILNSPSTSNQTVANNNNFVAQRPTRDALQRMVSVNRLNDRIRKKLEETTNNNEIYASTSIFDDYHHQPRTIKEEDDDVTTTGGNVPSETSNRRAEKIVDDSFRFITENENNNNIFMRTTTNPFPFDGNNNNNINDFDGQQQQQRRIRPSSPIKKKQPSGFQRYERQLQQQGGGILPPPPFRPETSQQQQQQQQRYESRQYYPRQNHQQRQQRLMSPLPFRGGTQQHDQNRQIHNSQYPYNSSQPSQRLQYPIPRRATEKQYLGGGRQLREKFMEEDDRRQKRRSQRNHFRSLTDPQLLTTTTTTRITPTREVDEEEIIYSSSQNSIVFDTQHHQPRPSTSRVDSGGVDGDGSTFLNNDKSANPNSHHLIHNIPIKMINNNYQRKRADSLDSGSLRLNNSSSKYEKDPHPTPLTASDWHTPAISRRPSISHRKRDSFQIIDRQQQQHQQRPPYKNPHQPQRGSGGYPSERYEPPITSTTKIPTRRISSSQLGPSQASQVPSQRQVPYRRVSSSKTRRQRLLPKKTPSLLRRDSYYYRKCDICLNQPRLDGMACYACNSVNSYKPRTQRIISRRISRNDYLQSRNNVPQRKQQQNPNQPNRIPSSSMATRFPTSQPPPPPPPPVTIEPYFEDVEEVSNETSTSAEELNNNNNNQIPLNLNAYPPSQQQQSKYISPNSWQNAATIPPRTPSQNGFFVVDNSTRFPYNTSPRRSKRGMGGGGNGGILNAEGLQKHPSYMAGYKRPSNIPIPPSYIPNRAQPSPNQQSRQSSTVIWPSNAGPAWKSIDHHRSRVNPSPIFRYGKQVPKWLYDYDAYAEAQKHKEMKQRRRKVFAIIVVFLLFALVVAAGVVLAAVN